MAQITLNIPDAQVQRVVDALCGMFLYEETAQEGESRPQFAKRMLAQILRERVVAWEQEQARRAAADDVTAPDIS